MVLLDELRAVLGALDDAGMDYALVGALAVAVWGLESVWASRVRLPFGDDQISVISRDALIGMKARAARPQDLMDIQNLKDGDR